MLARGTVNLFRRITNVYTRNILMKQAPQVTIHRAYLLPLLRQHQTYDLFAALNDNPAIGIRPLSWALLYLSMGFIFGYYLCRVNNDTNNFQYYCYVRFPHQM